MTDLCGTCGAYWECEHFKPDPWVYRLREAVADIDVSAFKRDETAKLRAQMIEMATMLDAPVYIYKESFGPPAP